MSEAAEHHCPHCGGILTQWVTGLLDRLLGRDRRSGKDHSRFFALIDKAFDQWPEHHGFRPRDSEHLRGYLLVTVGHIDVKWIPAPPEYETPALLVLFRLTVEAAGMALEDKVGYIDYRVGSAGVEIVTPRTIRFKRPGRAGGIDQKAFNPIREAVEALIEEAIGVPAVQLLRARAA